MGTCPSVTRVTGSSEGPCSPSFRYGLGGALGDRWVLGALLKVGAYAFLVPLCHLPLSQNYLQSADGLQKQHFLTGKNEDSVIVKSTESSHYFGLHYEKNEGL